MPELSFENVAITGGSGNLGSQIVKSLLAESKLNITVLQRAGSTSTHPESPRVRVESGDYTSPEFLKSALKGQHVLINTVGLGAPPSMTEDLYDAAVAVGIKWIVPGGFGCDFQDDEFAANFQMMAVIRQAREKLGERGVGYTGFITGPWLDYGINSGLFSIDVQARKASLYKGADAKFNTTTLANVGLGIARFLSLCAEPDSGTTLDQYRNTEVYLSSFLVSQKDVLESVQRVTETTTDDWDIDSSKDVSTYIAEGGKMMQEGNMGGIWNLLFGNLYSGVGGDYETMKGLSNERFGMPKMNLDDEVRRAIGASGHYEGHLGLAA